MMFLKAKVRRALHLSFFTEIQAVAPRRSRVAHSLREIYTGLRGVRSGNYEKKQSDSPLIFSPSCAQLSAQFMNLKP